MYCGSLPVPSLDAQRKATPHDVVLLQPPFSKAQQMSLARLADWIVADIVHSARSRRQRERRRMMELMSIAQKQIENNKNFKAVVLDMLRTVYPEATIDIHTSTDEALVLEGGTEVPTNQIEHDLWEDSEYFDYLIEQFNHLDPVAPRVVRVVAAQCASQSVPTYLAVGSKDYRVVFYDIDSSFVHMASQMLCRGWQSAALREALDAKENFLRGITHQFRTPIHGILGSVELLAEELGLREMAVSCTDSRRGSFNSTVSGTTRILWPISRPYEAPQENSSLPSIVYSENMREEFEKFKAHYGKRKRFLDTLENVDEPLVCPTYCITSRNWMPLREPCVNG
ncbi:hypothetical protein BU23DRAFT_166173 [Bimuria novae-zelandiae CBS 107.79]|uniref:Signal transduction histidine kinase dimerisation/phosphoacceptor domain-containing protein n=1 Tax=Bimuria novae-zelandiae CBS 107.79 TaxID=1447943 RepID=A0A6A5V4Z1_9PLEO|nr:hypothetical protein BU23DRAFT_166173 [Bimuria novae-zelandiae CBS 107.79]